MVACISVRRHDSFLWKENSTVEKTVFLKHLEFVYDGFLCTPLVLDKHNGEIQKILL